MARERKLTVTISGDARGLNRALGDVRTFGGKLSSGMGRVGRAGALAFGGAMTAGVGGALVALGTGFNGLVRIEKINAQTAAAIKSTGGAAGVSAKQVEELAGEIEGLTGIEAESIQEGQNLLLTFTGIRNEAGKGNDIFDQATKTLVDMSVAMGGDARSSAIQMGKALNDPVKGITALTRVGVTFTDEQKNMITQLSESGDVMGAQKIILAELNKEFGGSAKAFGDTTGGKIAKLKHKFGELTERIASGLLPVAERIADWGTKVMPKVIEKLGPVFDSLIAGAQDAGRTFQKHWPAIQRVVGQVVRKVVAFASSAIAYFQKHWPTIQRVVGQVFEAVMEGVQFVVGVVRQYWPQISAIITDAVEMVRSVIERFVSIATGLWRTFGDNILSFVRRVWPNIQQVIDGVLRVIRGIIKTVTSLIKGDWSGAWNGVKAIVSGAWSVIQGAIKNALEAIRLAISVAFETIGNIVKGATRVVIDKVKELWRGLLDFFRGIPAKVTEAAGHMFEGLKRAARSVINWLIDAWNKLDFGINIEIPSWVPGVGGKGFKVDDIIPDIPRLAHGGRAMRGGAALVGEAGPEILNLPRGAEVIPLSRGAGARAGLGAGATIVLQLAAPPGADQRWLDWLAETIARDARQRGRLSAAIRKAAG